MGRPRTVYRGKRKYRVVIATVLCVLLVLILAGVWLFNYMQKYIVYDKDGLEVVLPFMQTEAPQDGQPAAASPDVSGQVDAQVVVDDPDLSGVELGAGEGVGSLKAMYIPAESVTAANIAYALDSLESEGENAVVLQLKPASGQLAYLSSVALADSYGVNGTEDLKPSVAALRDKGIYVAAEISCLVDNAMAERNTPLALKSSSGAAVRDQSGAWLDPYNEDVRAYISGLVTELAGLGVNEVILAGIGGPQTGDVVFSQKMTGTPSMSGGISAFSLRMSQTARALGIRCSAVYGGTSQDKSLIFRLFDRVYVKTDADSLAADVKTLETALGAVGSPRIVPVVSGFKPDTDSWAVK